MGKYQKSQNEIFSQLFFQMSMMEDSCDSYDAGKTWEAARIATCICNIVNDGRNKTKSLMTQLHIRQSSRFYSSLFVPPSKNAVSGIRAPLCALQYHTDGRPVIYAPRFGSASTQIEMVGWIRFEQWWKEKIYTSVDGKPLSRMQLMLAVRNRDGGAHVDAELADDAYLDLRNQRGEEKYWSGDNLPLNAVEASVRQIGWELTHTFLNNSWPQFNK